MERSFGKGMSSAFNKKTIPEQFADKLMADILENKFGAMLPSVRELVVRYGLNPVSIHKGITSLVRRGVLQNNGPRRRLTIIAHSAAKTDCAAVPSGKPCCHPLIFVGADPSEINSTLMMATHDIVHACRNKGGACVTVILAGLDGKAKEAAIKKAMIEHKPSHVLLLYCDQEAYDLISPRVEKVAILGGIINSRKAVRLAADLALLAVAAFEDLVKLDHRHFRLIKLGRQPSPEAIQRLKAFSRERGVDAQAVFGGELSMVSMKRALDASLKAGVTAFAFPRPEDFVLANAYFEVAGVKIPKEVSVVLLLSGPYDLMQVVKPAHFKIGKEAIISLVLDWFEFGENRSERITRESMRTYVRGLTVGPACKVN
jgi:DNA-binding LacI/PurR family transcriptional regulator